MNPEERKAITSLGVHIEYKDTNVHDISPDELPVFAKALVALSAIIVLFSGITFFVVNNTVSRNRSDAVEANLLGEVPPQIDNAENGTPKTTMEAQALVPSAVAQFDPATLQWVKVTDNAPFERRDAGVLFEFNKKLFYMGGVLGDRMEPGITVKYWIVPHANDIWSSADGVSWALETKHAEWNPRRSMSVIQIGEKLFMFGGWSPVEGYANDIWTSNDGVHWILEAQKTPWEAREGQTLTMYDGKIWMIGGVNFDKRKMYNDVWYSGDGLRWNEALTNGPWIPRYDHAVENFNGRLWLTGGLELGGLGHNDVWSTNDGVNWRNDVPHGPWSPRHGSELVASNDTLYLISGWDTVKNTGADEVWWSHDGERWFKTLIDTPWRGREDHASLIFDNKLWSMNGMAGGSISGEGIWTHDIWYAPLDSQ